MLHEILDRIAEWSLDVLDFVPRILGADPQNAALVRALMVLLLIVVIVYVIGMRPFGRR
jgi:hypothetical protein